MNKKTQQKISPIEEVVMTKIKKGEVHIRPRSYYIFLGILSITSVILLGFISSYFISVAALWARIEASMGPAYGARQNLADMMGSFPWWALFLGILSLVGIIYLIKKVGKLYKIRLMYLVLTIIILFIAVGFILSYSSLPNMFNTHKQSQECSASDTGCRPLSAGYYRNKK